MLFLNFHVKLQSPFPLMVLESGPKLLSLEDVAKSLMAVIEAGWQREETQGSCSRLRFWNNLSPIQLVLSLYFTFPLCTVPGHSFNVSLNRLCI